MATGKRTAGRRDLLPGLENGVRAGIVAPVKTCLISVFLAMAATAAAGGVSISPSRRSVTVSNGVIAAEFSLRDGNLTGLRHAAGGELLGGGGQGYFDMTAMDPQQTINLAGAEFSVVRNEDALAEIAFTRKSPAADLALHYVLRAGEPGLYVFVVHRHTAAMPPLTVAQKRYVLRADPKIFNYAITSQRRHGPMPATAAMRKGEEIMDATYRLADGSIYTKYDWADFFDGHWGHGVCGTNAGLWMLFGSTECFMGGPTKQELMVHQTDTTPVLLAMFTGEHFLGEKGRQRIEGDWARLYGPVFLYVNGGPTAQAMFADAARRARQFAAQWPCDWLRHPLYPLERGAISGRLHVDGAVASNATVLLAAPEPGWQLQWKRPLFWSHTDAHGAFSLSGAAPGSYTLYIFCPGIWGEFRRDDVVVSAGATNNLGTLAWSPASHGALLWQIGTPDRTAGEFRHGGAPREHRLLALYRSEFPNDVNFVIGRSRERDDWNFAQPAGRTWNVLFTLTNAPRGTATLSIAIAGCDHAPTLDVVVNGSTVASLKLDDDGALRRSATLAGRYRLEPVTFAAALLRAGENAISLRLRNRGPWGAVMYDGLRLEAGEDDAAARPNANVAAPRS